MLRSIDRSRLLVVLIVLGLVAACGDDDDRLDGRDGGDGGDGSRSDGGRSQRDAGGPGGRKDAGAGTHGGMDGGPAIEEFAILGISGPDDDVVDSWLMGGTKGPIVTWEPSTGAGGYEVTIYEADGETVHCTGMKRPADAITADFADCELNAGREYRASVVASAGKDVQAASNDGFAFAAQALVLGRSDPAINGPALGLALPNDVVIVGSKLIVADQNNSRVLIWNKLPTESGQAPDLVLGQPDLTTAQADYGGVGANTFRGSNSVASDGTHLIVGDRFNHRVMIWNEFPTENDDPADVVLGQPDFTTIGENSGGISASSMTEPWVWLGGGKLFVADRNNVRVLIWNTIPTVSHTAADVVLGQPDFVSSTVNNGGLSASSFADPGRGWVDGTRLLVPDLANHRVLIWNTIPTANNAAADLVLGQPNMTTNTPGTGNATTAAGLYSPIAVYASGNLIAVADYLNNRVLLWTAAIAASGQAADVVLGQPNATGSTSNAGGDVSASSMASPSAVGGDSSHLVVSDRFNHRVLIWNAIPSENGSAADLALGQPDLTSGRISNPGAVTAASFTSPMDMALLGDRFALSDSDDSRVLIWDAPPTSPSDEPAIVLGQPDFTSYGPTVRAASATTFCGFLRVHSDGTRLAVGEQCNRRISIWSALPTETQQPADFAVGQPDLMSSVDNNGGVSAHSLSGRPQAHLDGQHLIVADPNNNRVLIWNAVPTASNSSADLVLGQPDMASATLNNGGVSATSLANPLAAYVSDGKLLVADSTNHRVLIWNEVPTASTAPADVVLGQPNMTSSSELTPSARSIGMPQSIHVDAKGRLYVVDIANHRVLYWNAIPTENYTAADGVIGQPTFTTGLANNGGLSVNGLQGPNAVLSVGERLYVADTGNNRVLVMPRP